MGKKHHSLRPVPPGNSTPRGPSIRPRGVVKKAPPLPVTAPVQAATPDPVPGTNSGRPG